jgi:hypothetical protein
MDDVTVELANRLTRLESENRRLRSHAVMALLVATVLGGLAAVFLFRYTLPVTRRETVEARRFVVRDTAGIARASLDLDGLEHSPRLVLFDSTGKLRASLLVEGNRVGTSELRLDSGESAAMMTVIGSVAHVTLLATSPETRNADLSKGTLALKLLNGSPSLTLSDELNGHPSAVLGHVNLVNTQTREKTDRSASSLVLFGGDGKVVWRTP